ncbi:hypothetical protein FQA39_LY15800 [Lamprigera yunnana]|nr:hypothetical protein FQA39_LY15800 [Lamprigera yunnana]
MSKVVKEKDDQGEVEVLFLRKSVKVSSAFYYPEKEDIATVNIKDIKLILPPPEHKKGTKRLQSFLMFELLFDNLHIVCELYKMDFKDIDHLEVIEFIEYGLPRQIYQSLKLLKASPRTEMGN